MVMEFTLRPYVTAGIVVAGAGLIAATPLGPPMEVQTHAVRLVDVVSDLTGDQAYPIASWTDAYDDTVSNLQYLDKVISDDPTPILSQIETNLTGYASEITTGFQTSSDNLSNALQELGPLLTTASSDLQSGDVYDALTSLEQFLLGTPLEVSRPVFGALFDVSQSMVNNLDNVLGDGAIYTNGPVTDSIAYGGVVPEWFTDLREAPLFGPNAADYAIAGVGQDISDAIQQGDTSLALSDLANAPSTILDAYLNGYDTDGGAKGFVSDYALRVGLDPSEGALNGGREAVINAEDNIASDLGAEGLKGQDVVAAAASGGGEANTVVGDLSTLLNPDTALGELATAFDPNALADLTSLLSGDLAPNSSAWVVDLFSGL
jgi:hypothetical protein